jgi:tetratricopeptide (TPR) repeat protein/transcriptional regulator with XRE-family HTH domain
VAEPIPVTFGELLRQLRLDSGLTLEALAERASVAVRTISDLELGKARSPRESTVAGLAWALRLEEPARARFIAVARGRPVPDGLPATSGTSPPQTLPRDIGSFTGRDWELAELTEAAASAGSEVAVHAISGMAGIGKTALAVRAAHRLASRYPDGQIFLALKGHAPGQQPVTAVEALAILLQTAGVDPRQIPAGLEARALLWRHWLAGKRMLLLLDDAADSDQVRPLLPGSPGNLVLVTSRQELTALEDAHPVRLAVLATEEAARLVVRLAGRPDLDPGDPAVALIAGLCGNLPLALGILGRQLRHSPAWTPGDLAADLTRARDRLAQMHAESLSVAAAFDLSYRDLSDAQRHMFRRLGLHLGSDIDSWAAAALAGTGVDDARGLLRALSGQNLITEPARGRYRLHDLIREHARSLAEAHDPPAERAAATGRLLDYYQRAAAHAEALLARQTRPQPPGLATAPARAPNLSNREQALSWARTERANLLACLDHAAATGQAERVVALTAGVAALLRHDGPWAEAISRHTAAAEFARRLGDRLSQANALDELGIVLRLTGDYRSAAQTQQEALSIYTGLGSRLGRANALSHLGYVRSLTDDYPQAAADLREALALYHEIGDRLGQPDALNHLATVLRLTGDFQGAAQTLERALTLCRELGYRQGEANALIYLGAVRLRTRDHRGAAESLEAALGIFLDLRNRLGQANALSYLGTVSQETGDYQAAAKAYREALDIYRDLGNRLGQANTIGDLGILSRLTGNHQAAAEAQEEALDIYRALGDQMGQASALNELGMLSRLRGDLDRAQEYHGLALDLARGIESSWDEGQALAGLGRTALAAGRTAEARDRLRRAQEAFGQADAAAEEAQITAELDALDDPGPGAAARD